MDIPTSDFRHLQLAAFDPLRTLVTSERHGLKSPDQLFNVFIPRYDTYHVAVPRLDKEDIKLAIRLHRTEKARSAVLRCTEGHALASQL
ncbi:hypothetical protein ACWIDZ_03940 [Brevundimonas sp. NPDC055311]